MNSFWEKHKLTIIVVAVLLIIAGIIAIYLAGKKSGKIAPPKVKYPHGGEDIPAGWNAEPVARELHDVMDGVINFPGARSASFRKYADLPTDEMFIAVYDVFNQLFMNEGYGTLYEWIDDEWMMDNVIDMASGEKGRVMDRMDELNLG